MKKLIALAVMGLMFSVSAPVLAGAQQEKMKACNVEATGKKGDERKAFMKACLSKEGASAAAADNKPTQQNKMKTCNEEAKGKTGDERKAFMSSCLKK
jgi:uncharacterized surface anchored protein